MRSALLLLHSAILSLGFAKAFELADLEQLGHISRPMGYVWLGSAVLFGLAAGLSALDREWWWLPAAVGLVSSTVVIVASWDEAKAGLIVNLIVLPVVLAHAFGRAPGGCRSRYARAVRDQLARGAARPRTVTESDLAQLPEPVARYLRFVGVVGRPEVRDYRYRFDMALREGPDRPYLHGVAEQHSFTDPPARLFLYRGRKFGLPIEAFHRYVGRHATFSVRLASLLDVVDARGDEMDRAETVTLFADMCLLAPATLTDPSITWEQAAASTVRGSWSNAGNPVSAVLTFSADGALSAFHSDDRGRSDDLAKWGLTELDPGTAVGSPNRVRWSTTVTRWGDLDGRMAPLRGHATWHLPGGDFTYAEFRLTDREFNATTPRASSAMLVGPPVG